MGDVTGDGQNELVIATERSVYVTRVTNETFNRLGKFELFSKDQVASLDLADLNGDGVMEIFVSNQRGMRPYSFVLGVTDGKLVPLAEGLPFYFRMVYLPDGAGASGAGRRSNLPVLRRTEHGEYTGGHYTLGRTVTLTKGANIFNFAQARLTGSDKVYTILVKDDGK